MQLEPNAVVAGRFRLNRMIGRGGMGSVWHATQLGLDVPCAVKFIEGELSASDEAHMRFEREAKAAAALRSPNVVQIIDHGVFEGTPYIAMELLDGEDLGARIRRGGAVAPAAVHEIVEQVCRALTKAHAMGIVHRDLKPDNIFLVRDDDREIAKVLDFGIAKRTSADVMGAQTRTGALLGTPYYMSPEQARGVKALDFRSDLWSLAVIVFECLVGRPPFEADALGALLIKIMFDPLPVPSQIAPGLPRRFDSWWVRAATREPEGRFQSAKELADSLALALGITRPPKSSDLRHITGPSSLAVPSVPTPAPQYPTPAPQYPPPTPPPAHAVTTGRPFAQSVGTAAAPPRPAASRRVPIVVAATAGIVLLASAGLTIGVVAHSARSDATGNAAAPTASGAAATPASAATITPSAPAASVASPSPPDSSPSVASSAAASAPRAPTAVASARQHPTARPSAVSSAVPTAAATSTGTSSLGRTGF
jgi:serine/threonine-protein kinase